MAQEKQPQKEQIKVTDKRIFTPDGQIREEFREEIHPAEAPARASEQTPEKPAAKPDPPKGTPTEGARRRTLADKGANPGTPFTNFIEPLIANVYMSLGMLRNPYQPQTKPDTMAARQMIEILTLLHEKTAGNLTPEEEDFLNTHLGELKLAFVQTTKSL